MRYKASITILFGCLLLSYSSFAAPRMTIDREVTLSLGHKAMPHLITRAPNGDFIVAGSTGGTEFRAWAIRVDSGGKPLWEYVDGGPTGWNDFKSPGHHFYGAVDLPNQETLLCGLKDTTTSRAALLVRVRRDGSVIDERPLEPGRPGVVVEIRCTQWADGIALAGAITGNPSGIGWLVKLDAQGNFVWEKFAEYYGYGGMIEAPAGNLIMISVARGKESVVKINSDGELLASHPLKDDEKQLVHPAAPRASARIAFMLSTSLETEISDFDDALRGPLHTKTIANAGFKKCLELADGTVVLFGSQFHHSATTASIAVLYRDGASNVFPIEPAYQSPWFIDAVPSGADREFATVRQVDGAATLAWISIR